MSRKAPNNSTAISNFISRALHVGLTTAIFLILSFTNTVLNRDMQDGRLELPLLFGISTVTSVFLYFVVSLMDPGYVKESDLDVKPLTLGSFDSEDEAAIRASEHQSVHHHKNSGYVSTENETETVAMLSDSDEEIESSTSRKINEESRQRCGFCAMERPIRARHCRECKRCVRKFDHHCPWIANCVGERNHRWFWMFLTVELFLIVWSIYISITGYTGTGNSQEWMKNNILLLLTDVFLVIFFFVVISLCSIHTYMAFSNHTTWESMSRHRITYLQKIEIENPFSLGYFRNAYIFLCHCKPYNWMAIYRSKLKKAAGSSPEDNI